MSEWEDWGPEFGWAWKKTSGDGSTTEHYIKRDNAWILWENTEPAEARPAAMTVADAGNNYQHHEDNDVAMVYKKDEEDGNNRAEVPQEVSGFVSEKENVVLSGAPKAAPRDGGRKKMVWADEEDTDIDEEERVLVIE